MRDRSTFWSAPAAAGARLAGDGIEVALLAPVPQVMVSGDLGAFGAPHGLPPAAGLLADVAGPRYALRMARRRMLAVGVELDQAAAGWAGGVATTPMTGAMAVIEIAGPRAMALVARATAVDPRADSPCAAVMFAGVTVALCRHEGRIRLHLDRGLATYMLDWCAAAGDLR